MFEEVVAQEVLAGGTTEQIKKYGSVLASWSCRPHDCGDVNWKIVLLVPKGTAGVCYHNAELMGDRSRWFIGGLAKYQFPGTCDWESPIPSQIVAALATAN